ncbi:TetR/AcrR family transcriptional regulator [Vibrio sp. Of7-15]|uniref:TetR/AcrR family transcriptional regulator n=1 Tax=Vibrio sp. Of7-15 TaxID=2724879 RepID=UPI001EF1909C|nr:TetR/AcrR family transcriptional regulator [Vibrio sp. Of7-15]MCG7496610.1 TetR/AcrR family transcriptional regulator [Vibrio sp. Of7-15]
MTKRQQTREKILQAAWGSFAQNGYEATTTRQIAKQAGVADGTVFSHFPTKLSILREGMLEQLTAISQDTLENAEGKTDVEIGLALTEQYYRYYFTNVELSRALLKEVIWDLDYYQSFNQALFQSASEQTIAAEKMPLILDCYFMTLITHLNRPEPNVELALEELHAKFKLIV